MTTASGKPNRRARRVEGPSVVSPPVGPSVMCRCGAPGSNSHIRSGYRPSWLRMTPLGQRMRPRGRAARTAGENERKKAGVRERWTTGAPRRPRRFRSVMWIVLALAPSHPRRGVNRRTELVPHGPLVTGHRPDPARREPGGRRPQVTRSRRAAHPVGLRHLLDGPGGRRRCLPHQNLARPPQLERGRLPLPRRSAPSHVVEPAPRRPLQGPRLRAPSVLGSRRVQGG